MALPIPPHLPGDISRAAAKASLRSLLPGRRYLCFYAGSDSVWHEQLAGWPVNDTHWAIYSTDGDVYVQDMTGGSMVSHLVLCGLHGQRPTGLGASIYGFRDSLDDASLLRTIALCRSTTLAARSTYGGVAALDPDDFVCWNGEMKSLTEQGLFGGGRRYHEKRGVGTPPGRALALGAGGGKGGGAAVPSLPITDAAADDHARVLLGRPATPVRGAPGLGAAVGGPDVFAIGTPDGSPGTPGRLLPREGHIWMVTTIGHFRYPFGSEVVLTPTSLVHGSVGVFIDSTGDSVGVEQVPLSGASSFDKDKLSQLQSILSGRGVAMPPAAEPVARPPAPDGAAALGDAAPTPGIAALGQRQPGAPATTVEPDAPLHPADFHRVLSLKGDQNGRPFREAREVANTLKPAKHPAWPLIGPRCAMWCLAFCISQVGGAFSARLQQLMSLAKLTYNDKHMTEYAVIAKTLEFLMSWDQVHFGNCVGVELLVRRLSLIEEKYKFRLPQFDGGGGGKDSVMDAESDAGLFLGLGSSAMAGRGAVTVMPEPSAHIGEELATEAAISKGKIKAHELRQKLTASGGKPLGQP